MPGVFDIQNGYFTRAGYLARHLTDTISSSMSVAKVGRVNYCTPLEYLLSLYAV